MRSCYTDYSQEKMEEYPHSYSCIFSKIPTTTFFGKLDHYDINCEFKNNQIQEAKLVVNTKPCIEYLIKDSIDEVDLIIL